MEMSNFLPELHVAQQSRREKLRVPSTSTSAPPQQQPHEHFDDDLLPPPGGPPLALPLDTMMNYDATPATTTTTIHHPARFAVPTICENWAIPCYVDYENDQDQRRMFPQGIFNNNNNELPLLPSFVGGNNETSTPQAGSLSLTLSSNQIRQPEPGTISSVVDQMVSRIRGGGGGGNQQAQDTAHLYRNVGPLGPFTGYTTILRNSKFLKPAQLLLEEFLNAAGLRINIIKECEVEAESNNINNGGSKSRCSINNDQLSSGGSGSCESYKPDCHEKKAKLLHMQEEVCKRHKQYHQQMQMVMSAFESVPGLGNATPYISRSVKIISRHFRCIKNAIADQLKHIKKALGEDLSSSIQALKGESTSLRFDRSFSTKVKASSGGMGYGHQNHIWRPQRGLPERAVSILRAWLFDHFLHPYPTDTDKQMLATQTGLSRNQVSNWFINARVRLWKPMVEEIHMLETKGAVARSDSNLENAGMSMVVGNRYGAGNQPAGCKQAVNVVFDKRFEYLGGSSSSLDASRGETSSEQIFQKRSRLESHQIPNSMDGSLIGFLPYQRRGLEIGGIGAVSLTLGLRHGSETSQQQLQHHQFPQQGLHFGSHVIHDFSG